MNWEEFGLNQSSVDIAVVATARLWATVSSGTVIIAGLSSRRVTGICSQMVSERSGSLQ